MMSSTYAVLRSQGLPTKKLSKAAALTFCDGAKVHMPDEASWRFWSEVIASRRGFLLATGANIETMLA